MNHNRCFEYQQLMLRYNQKNKALLAEEKKIEMSKYQEDKHKQDGNKEKSLRSMVLENDNIVKIEEEKKALEQKRLKMSADATLKAKQAVKKCEKRRMKCKLHLFSS